MALGSSKMKINEVTDKQLDEGILDRAKQAYQGAKGFVQGGVGGAKAGWGQQGAKNAQQGIDNKVAQAAGQKWAQVAQQIQSSTGKPPTTIQAHDWLKQLMGGQEPTSAPPNANPATIYKWLQKEVANYSSKKAMGQPNAAQPAQSQQQQPTQQPTAKADPKQYDTAEQQLVQAMDAVQRMTKEQLLKFKQQLQQAA